MAQRNEQATNITARINTLEAVPNIDINYGPYTSVHEAYTTLSANEAIAQGLTVGIQETTNSPITEYWFKNGITEADLVMKSSGEGVTSYNNLEDKPSIDSNVLSGNMTFKSIGGTSIRWYDEQTPQVVDRILLNGNKLTFYVNDTEYSFALSTWYEVSDFYVMFGNITEISTNVYDIGNGICDGKSVPYEDVNVNYMLSLAVDEHGYKDTEGNMMKARDQKESFNVGGYRIPCDYVIDTSIARLRECCNSIFVMYNTSSGSSVTLDKIAWYKINDETSGYLYDVSNGIDILNNSLMKENLMIEDNLYTLVGYNYEIPIRDISFGINVTKTE